jgi:SAM-dependent methyltransferase
VWDAPSIEHVLIFFLKGMHMNQEDVRREVKSAYGAIARKGSSCCEPSCSCGPSVSERLGYAEGDLDAVPAGADLGLGCGNPTVFASLREGETVLDLGSGAGLDCFLAAQRVGETGRVIGVDMTPEMIEKASANAKNGGYANVEFRLGEIERLPVGDASADVVISNCVINLVPDKARAFAEAFRVLKPGGRLMVSDIVLTRPLPDWLLASKTAYSACVSGAELRDRYLASIKAAGFRDITVVKETPFTVDLIAFAVDRCCGSSVPGEADGLGGTVVSISVSARKPMI